MRISNLQMTEGTGWVGYTSRNHLGAIYQDSPQKASQMVTRIRQATFGNDIDTFLGQFSPLYLENGEDYTWDLEGSGTKNVPLVEARIAGSTVVAGDEPGKNFSQFELVFAENWFSDVNVIVGEKNEKYPLRVLGEPVLEGTNYVYTVMLVSGDEDLFMPLEELEAGKRFSKDFSSVEQELSNKGGLVHFTSPFKMRNALTMIRMEHTAAGNMIGAKVEATYKGEDGKVYGTWMEKEEWEFDRQFQMEKNRSLVYSTSNRKPDGTYADRGKSGNVIKQGAGLRQQMESANTLSYNSFNIDWLIDTMLQLTVGKISEGERNLVMMTGEFGSVQFHKAIEDYTQLFTPNLTDTRFFGSGQDLGYGGQFKQFNGPQGIKLTVMTNSMYDNPERNKVKKQGNKGLAESYRYDIMDLGTSNGEPNIRKVCVKGAEDIMGYEPGLRDPFSPTGAKPKIMANPTDGYKTHRATVCGIMVKDPSRTATLLPTELM